ncbi:hypothetical protein [Paenibacillus sp. RC67]|nr:hypothetical protein [Paenibacillus sp. RC67]
MESTCWENDRSKQNETIEIRAVKISSKLEMKNTNWLNHPISIKHQSIGS